MTAGGTRSGYRRPSSRSHTFVACCVNFIRTSIYDKYSGSMKITTHLDPISHCKTLSHTNWSNRWTYRNIRRNYIASCPWRTHAAQTSGGTQSGYRRPSWPPHPGGRSSPTPVHGTPSSSATLYSKSYTLNPKSCTLNPESWTPNSRLSNTKP